MKKLDKIIQTKTNNRKGTKISKEQLNKIKFKLKNKNKTKLLQAQSKRNKNNRKQQKGKILKLYANNKQKVS